MFIRSSLSSSNPHMVNSIKSNVLTPASNVPFPPTASSPLPSLDLISHSVPCLLCSGLWPPCSSHLTAWNALPPEPPVAHDLPFRCLHQWRLLKEALLITLPKIALLLLPLSHPFNRFHSTLYKLILRMFIYLFWKNMRVTRAGLFISNSLN